MVNEIDKAYRRLAAEIVRQAVKDYKKAFMALAKAGGNEKMVSFAVRNKLAECREFFASDWYSELCTADGQKVIKAIEKKVYKELGFTIL